MSEVAASDRQDAGARIAALPIWRGRIRWEPLKGGLSNESFAVEDGSGRYVVRFCRDFPFHHVSRADEVAVARAAHAAGFAPEVVHAGPGVMVSRFVEGRTYGAADVRAQVGRIAALVRRFHAQMPSLIAGPAALFWPFHIIRDYARTLGESRMAPRLPGFLALAEELERAQVPMPIVFGHHDLLPANFIDDGRRLWLIDFEYSRFGTAVFDLAFLAAMAEFGEAETDELLTACLGRPPDEAFRRSHAAMRCTALLREAMWSMVSELYLDAPGADYVAYADQNLGALEAEVAEYRERFG